MVLRIELFIMRQAEAAGKGKSENRGENTGLPGDRGAGSIQRSTCTQCGMPV